MLAAVEATLSGAGYEVEDSELRWIAKNETELQTEKAVQNMRLMEQLEELDDVETVATNLQITDAIAEAFGTA
jgi:transcriptional/translational regulatory protein YebC/TACO1